MLLRFFAATLFMFAGVALSNSARSAGSPPSPASSTPTLFTVEGAPRSLAAGAQQMWSVKVDEDRAMEAVFKGGMWLPNAAGDRVYARYIRHILHPDGTWTWVGKVATNYGEQSAVITFAQGAVFGRIPQPNGFPLQLVTQHGSTALVKTSGEVIGRSATAAMLRAGADVRPVPVRRGNATALTTAQSASVQAQEVTATAASTGSTMIDVMVAYTPGFVSEFGSQSAALARINNLVDIANQAYVDSKINQSIRLVNAVEVNYPDNTSNDSALDDITGYDSNGNPVPVPPSLQQIASLRAQYGADLVSLVRKYDNATNGGCGLAWIIGGNEQPIVPSQDKPYGYSVVGDGSDGGYYCLDTSFAHELGHNMGDAHDRANADQPGAYPYSYGYVSSSSTGFGTIMAYPGPKQTPLAVFSNPNISICQNQPCGVADSASNSADNAHSMNNTASLIAQFEPTIVPSSVASTHVHNDVTGSGKSDLLWYNAQSGQMAYWVMNGATRTSSAAFSVPAGYQPIATGDFDGNGAADVLWNTPAGLYMWLSNGSSFASLYVGAYPSGWVFAGAADVNGDGNTDLLWYNPSTGQATYWLMSGTIVQQWRGFSTSAGLTSLTTGDFDDSGRDDVIWKASDGSMYMWLFNSAGSFSYYNIGKYPAGWTFAGTGDVNNDGKTDLFWYNPATGQTTYWLMNGAKLTSWKAFSTNIAIQPLATGMFDGTNAGLTWNVYGSVYMWIFSGATPKYYSLGAYPSGWMAIP
jgi:hypothetical protein